jgi:hypothetical protein
VPIIYDGPKPEGGEVKREVGAILEEYMLALEVGPSSVVQGERGLYIRLIGKDVEESTVEWGSILCGYGEGSMQPLPGAGDKSVLFSLPTAEAAVFYNKEVGRKERWREGGYSIRMKFNPPPSFPPPFFLRSFPLLQLVPIFEVLASLPDGTGLQG